jgi:hypothetical protein
MMVQPISEALFPLSLRRRLALDAELDLRTFNKVLAGGRVRPGSRERTARALAAAGLLELLPDAEAKP